MTQTDANGRKRLQTDANECKRVQTEVNLCKRLKTCANGRKRMHKWKRKCSILEVTYGDGEPSGNTQMALMGFGSCYVPFSSVCYGFYHFFVFATVCIRFHTLAFMSFFLVPIVIVCFHFSMHVKTCLCLLVCLILFHLMCVCVCLCVCASLRLCGY